MPALPIRSILVPTDFSPHADAAVGMAIDLAKSFGAKIYLLHAYHLPVTLTLPDQLTLPQTFWDEVRAGAERQLRKVQDRVRAAGVAVSGELATDTPASAAVEMAARIGVDLIVMGTRGLAGLRHVLLGSVAERTVRLAPCPVMTVKSKGEK